MKIVEGQLKMRTQAGATLIELLIGITVGLMVATGALSMLVVSTQGQADNIRLARLNQDLRAMMDIMVRDIRRSGFVTNRPNMFQDAILKNPFFDNETDENAETTDIKTFDYDGGLDNCIVYTYNRDYKEENKQVDLAIANDEIPDPPDADSSDFFGFRLESDGVLKMRRSGSTNESCENGNWETFTEPEVEISDVTFTLSSLSLNVTSMNEDDDDDGCTNGDDNCNDRCDAGEGCNTCIRNGSPDPACLMVRSVNISLTGRLRNDNNVAHTLKQKVRIRNDLFLDAVP